MEYKYWIVSYVSCEGNKRHTVAKTPSSWDENQVQYVIPIGGCGDDIAEIISIEETFSVDNCFFSFE